MKTTRGVRSCLKAPLGSACCLCKDSCEVVYREKTEVSNEQAESVEHVKVRSTKSKTGKPRLLNTEPLPGGGGTDQGGIEPETGGGGAK